MDAHAFQLDHFRKVLATMKQPEVIVIDGSEDESAGRAYPQPLPVPSHPQNAPSTATATVSASVTVASSSTMTGSTSASAEATTPNEATSQQQPLTVLNSPVGIPLPPYQDRRTSQTATRSSDRAMRQLRMDGSIVNQTDTAVSGTTGSKKRRSEEALHPPQSPTAVRPGRQSKRRVPATRQVAELEDRIVRDMLHSGLREESTRPPDPPSLRSLFERPTAQDLLPPRPAPLRLDLTAGPVRLTPRTHFVTQGDVRLVPVRWPSNIVRLADHYNPGDIRFQDVGRDWMCDCTDPCRVNTCFNGRRHVYCDALSCPFMGLCGNGLEPSRYLALMKNMNTKEHTVVATNTIDAQTVVGEYLGLMRLENFTANDRPANGGFRFYMHHDPDHPANQRVCIDAIRFGSLFRFMNHSCFPNARFRQVCNGKNHTIVIVTNRQLMPGEEILVDYGDELWFRCRCGGENCRHRGFESNSDSNNESDGDEDGDEDGEEEKATEKGSDAEDDGTEEKAAVPPSNGAQKGDSDFE